MSELRDRKRPAIAKGEFASPEAAEAWLAGVPQNLAQTPRSAVAGLVLGIEAAYDAFPEIELACPRRTILRHLRSAAAALPEAEALALLLLCAAADPSDRAALATLFESAARAEAGRALLPILGLFRGCPALGWDELAPAWAALVAGAAEDRVLLAAAAAMIETDLPREGLDEIGRVLAPLLCRGTPERFPAPALLRGAAIARRHLAVAANEADDAGNDKEILAIAARLRTRLLPLLSTESAAAIAWPRGDLSFPSFLAQWPDLALEVPARRLYTRYAALGADGVLRASRHKGETFCYGPYLNLPAGQYRVEVIGAAGPGADYTVAITRYVVDGPSPAVSRRFLLETATDGTIADLSFASAIEVSNFELVVTVASPAAEFAISAVRITAERLRDDPD